MKDAGTQITKNNPKLNAWTIKLSVVVLLATIAGCGGGGGGGTNGDTPNTLDEEPTADTTETPLAIIEAIQTYLQLGAARANQSTNHIDQRENEAILGESKKNSCKNNLNPDTHKLAFDTFATENANTLFFGINDQVQQGTPIDFCNNNSKIVYGNEAGENIITNEAIAYPEKEYNPSMQVGTITLDLARNNDSTTPRSQYILQVSSTEAGIHLQDCSSDEIRVPIQEDINQNTISYHTHCPTTKIANVDSDGNLTLYPIPKEDNLTMPSNTTINTVASAITRLIKKANSMKDEYFVTPGLHNTPET